MATIQKRLRFHATVRLHGKILAAKSFDRESQARTWCASELEARQPATPGHLSSEVKRRTSYRVMVRRRGYPTQYATFSRSTEAKRWAGDTESAIREGRYFAAAEARRHTLAEMVDRYLSTVNLEKAPSSRSDSERHLQWWNHRLGERLLSDVTPALIAEQRDLLAAETLAGGKKRAPATVNRYLASLSHAFTQASREWAWVQENPLRRVRRLKEPRGRVRFLSDEERDRLLAACSQSRNPFLHSLVVLALSTGARQGELLGLRWPDVDLERQLITVHHTKNKERRSVPLTGPALDEVQRLSKVRRIDTNLVFPGKDGKRPIEIRQAWVHAVRTAELEDFRFHDLRHTAASYLAMSGATLAEIAAVLGHKTLAMVKRYSHLTEAHTAGVVARMNERFLSV